MQLICEQSEEANKVYAKGTTLIKFKNGGSIVWTYIIMDKYGASLQSSKTYFRSRPVE